MNFFTLFLFFDFTENILINLVYFNLLGGADVLWKALDADFQSDDWRTRFAAVERVTVIFRFLPEKMGNRNTNSVKSVLSHAFCCLIGKLE